MNPPIIDFPKLRSPFVRAGNPYLVTPTTDPDLEWVFNTPGVKAVDKLDGTNVCVHIHNQRIVAADNRKTRKFDGHVQTRGDAWNGMLLEGLSHAIQRKWLSPNTNTNTSAIYGELIGPKINGNRHQLTHHLFVPFDYLAKSCHWKSFVQNTHPKTFEAISEWFKDHLPSLFNQRMKLPPIPAEGVVFHHPDGRMAKLRRDMFEWYHKTQE